MRIAAVMLLSLSVVSARADSLGDLKAAVAVLRATAPVRAAMEIQRSEIDKSKKPPETTTSGAAVEVAVDAEGLHVSYAPALLARLAKEQSDRNVNSEAPIPARHGIAGLGVLGITDHLDFGRHFLGMVARATVTSEKRVAYDGRPARLLTLKVNAPAPKSAFGKIEIVEDTLNVWMADDNLPLAAQRVERFKGGILFLKGEGSTITSWRFARKDDRLVATRSEEKSTTSGFGPNHDDTDIVTVTLR